MQHIQESTDSEADSNQVYDEKISVKSPDPTSPKTYVRKDDVVESMGDHKIEPHNYESKSETTPLEIMEDENDDDNSILNVEDLIDDNDNASKVDLTNEKSRPTESHLNLKVNRVVPLKEESQTLQTNDETCCNYKLKYEKLLEKHERTGDQLRTMSSNFELVSRQLVTRDVDMMDYMDTVSHLFNLVRLTNLRQLLLCLFGLFSEWKGSWSRSDHQNARAAPEVAEESPHPLGCGPGTPRIGAGCHRQSYAAPGLRRGQGQNQPPPEIQGAAEDDVSVRLQRGALHQAVPDHDSG